MEKLGKCSFQAVRGRGTTTKLLPDLRVALPHGSKFISLDQILSTLQISKPSHSQERDLATHSVGLIQYKATSSIHVTGGENTWGKMVLKKGFQPKTREVGIHLYVSLKSQGGIVVEVPD